MRDIKKQLEKLRGDGVKFSSEELPKNSLGYLKEYPLEFDAWVQRVRTTLSKYFSTDSAHNWLLEKGLHSYEKLLEHRNPDSMEEAKKTLLKALEIAIKSVNNDDFGEIVIQTTSTNQIIPKSKSIFIVHGHDDKLKNEVARFIEKLDLNPIILHEKPNKGKTIIEKFEEYSDVSFAVILLTDDDHGCEKNRKEEMKLRARQNVVFELGFFIGKLKRQNVCALYKKNVELPSDYDGVIYIPIDDGQGWELKLGREIKASGLDVDLNRLM